MRPATDILLKSKNLKIRPLTTTDLENIYQLQPEGWSDITYFFKFYVEHPFCYPVIALMDNDIAGVANAILNQDTGWISHVIVSENFRNRGIGTRITKTVSDYLKLKGCHTQSLIATEEGERIYLKLGFRSQCNYLFYKSKKLAITPDFSLIRKINKNDLDEISRLDKEVTGESRIALLQYFFKSGWVYTGNSTGRIAGFYLPELGEGHIIAEKNEAGLQLLIMKHYRKENTTVIPEENLTARKFLEMNDFQFHRSAPRMILGRGFPWKPEKIFSRSGGFYG